VYRETLQRMGVGRGSPEYCVIANHITIFSTTYLYKFIRIYTLYYSRASTARHLDFITKSHCFEPSVSVWKKTFYLQ